MSEAEYIKTKEAETKYSISRETLRQLVKSGKLKVYRAKGNVNYYEIAELEKVISELYKFRPKFSAPALAVI